jgi:hypothetical protein
MEGFDRRGAEAQRVIEQLFCVRARRLGCCGRV